jgi:hypothetical protein
MNSIAKVWPAPQVRHEALRIGGELIRHAEIIEVFNPYTNELVGTVPKATLADVRRAFAWADQYRARLTRYERSQILLRAADAVRRRTEEIAGLITAESGLCKAVRRHQGFGSWLQGRRPGSDEKLHQCEDLFAAVGLSGSLAHSRCTAFINFRDKLYRFRCIAY